MDMFDTEEPVSHQQQEDTETIPPSTPAIACIPHDAHDTRDIKPTTMKALRINIAQETIDKMRRISSLFSDEIPDAIKETDIVSFFVAKAFATYLKSGEIEKKIEEITGVPK